MVRHNYTHVGHEIEVRTQQLSKADQKYLVEQLEAGVNTDRIIKNARQQQSGAPSRLNLVTKNDLTNLMRRNNIEGMRHINDMVAVAMKVIEWNADGKNLCFLFKQLGNFLKFSISTFCISLKWFLVLHVHSDFDGDGFGGGKNSYCRGSTSGFKSW